MVVYHKTRKKIGVVKLASTFDKLKDREYSREEKIERLRRNVAYQKTLNLNTGRKKGTVGITNGTINKIVDADLPIPEGWRRGYCRKGANNEQQG